MVEKNKANEAAILDWAEFEEMAPELREGLVEHWGKKGQTERVERGALGVDVSSDYSEARPNKKASMALARCGTADGVRAFIEQSKKNFADPGKKLRGYAKALSAPFGPEVCVALRKGHVGVAQIFMEAAETIDGMISWKGPDGEVATRHAIELAMEEGLEEFALGAMKLHPEALAKLHLKGLEKAPGTGENWYCRSLLGKHGTERQSEAMEILAKLATLAQIAAKETGSKTLADPLGSLNETIKENLFYSKVPKIREKAVALMGEKERVRLIGKIVERSRSRFYIDSVAPLVDEALSKEFFSKLTPAEMVSAVDVSLPYNGTLAMQLIASDGGVKALEIFLNEAEKCSEGLGEEALLHTAWVWENSREKQRKKGDALAFCVVHGNQEAAELIVKRYPNISRDYAKAAVRYLQDRRSSAAQEATSTWENMVLTDLLEVSAPAPAAKKRSNSL